MKMVDISSQASEGVRDFQDFFHEEYARLVRALYLLTCNSADAEELAQECMVRVYERWPRVQTMENPSGYAYTVALNLWRRKGRIRRLVPILAELLPQGDVDQAEAQADVRRALSQLTREQQQVVVLTYWVGFSAEEAAKLLGIEASSVRGRALRARQALRHLLGGLND